MKLRICFYFGAEQVESDDLTEVEKDVIADTNMKKMFEWPTCPRVGEQVNIHGGEGTVYLVTHNLIQGYVEVDCETDLRNGAFAFMEDESDWDMKDMKPAAIALLRREARRHRKVEKKRKK